MTWKLWGQIAVIKNKRIEKLNEKIEELQEQNRYLREQQQKQQEEKFTALGYLQVLDNDVPIKVTVNVKTKSIEWMEVDGEFIKKLSGWHPMKKQLCNFLLHLFSSSILKCSF